MFFILQGHHYYSASQIAECFPSFHRLRVANVQRHNPLKAPSLHLQTASILIQAGRAPIRLQTFLLTKALQNINRNPEAELKNNKPSKQIDCTISSLLSESTSTKSLKSVEDFFRHSFQQETILQILSENIHPQDVCPTLRLLFYSLV